MFRSTPISGGVIDRYNNFTNFGFAMITLFRCSTGEEWYFFMFETAEVTPWSYLFFITFILITSFIMLNLFILIVLQYFEDYHMKEDNPL